MSDDFSWLEYDDELTDDDPVMIIRLSRYWLDKLVGVAEILKNPDLWHPSDDVDLALRQVDDLIVRLMGSDEEWAAMITALPVTIPATSMYWNSWCNADFGYAHVSRYLGVYGRTDNTNNTGIICTWTVPLQPGTYILTVFASKTSGSAKMSVTATVVGEIIPVYDLYDATGVAVDIIEGEFEIETAAEIAFSIIKSVPKNPASSNYRVIIAAASVRVKHGEE